MIKTLLSLALAVSFLAEVATAAPRKVVVHVEASPKETKGSRAISPWIYGFGTYFEDAKAPGEPLALRPSVIRWGGNTAERFNWETNAWNTGSDWFFMNVHAPFPDLIGHFMHNNAAAGIASIVTLPLNGWVAKDHNSVSFPKSQFPNQAGFDQAAGNGLSTSGDPLPADPKRTSVAAGPDFLMRWVNKLKTQFAPSDPHFYILGNEPMLWPSTHRDVHPELTSYDEVLTKFTAAAIAVRRADPDAVIIGPALWGWLAMRRSALDGQKDKRNADYASHGKVEFLPWFLREIAKKEAELHLRLIDVIDVHYYPEGDELRKAATPEALSAPRNRHLRLQATRSLWDPTYKDQSWIAEPIRFLPRLRELAEGMQPPRRFGVGEYNFRGETDAAGGVAVAEVLGLFAQYGTYMACYWTKPPSGSAAATGWRIVRNYDGKGGAFGDELLHNDHGPQAEVSVFSAFASKRHVTTVMVVNKDLGEPADAVITLGGGENCRKRAARLFQVQERSANSISSTAVTSEGPSCSFSIKAPPLSVSMLEIEGT